MADESLDAMIDRRRAARSAAADRYCAHAISSAAPIRFARAMTTAFSQSRRRRPQFDDGVEIAGAAAFGFVGAARLQADRERLGIGLQQSVRRSFQRPRRSGAGGGPSLAAAMGAIKPFAAGGVIGTPTYFPLTSGGLGLAGEAGPEAIMPLARGADGRLGVARGRRPRRQHHRQHRDAGRGELPPLGSLSHRPDRARGGARPAQFVTDASSLSRNAVSARHRAEERGRAGAAHRDRDARLRPRGAQRALGAFAPPL